MIVGRPCKLLVILETERKNFLRLFVVAFVGG